MDHVDLVYKVDYLVQSSLLSSLMLILIQGSFSWSTLRSWVCNSSHALNIIILVSSIIFQTYNITSCDHGHVSLYQPRKKQTIKSRKIDKKKKIKIKYKGSSTLWQTYYLELLSTLQRLYLVFNVIKLTITLKDIISTRYLNLSPNFIIIDRKEE